jgi:hypothetical protein
MAPLRLSQREHYRLPLTVTYPVMFSDSTTIGEGRVTNLSVCGCTMECVEAVPVRRNLLVRLILPDRKESLPIERAEVRWVKDKLVGLRFSQLERAANLRLHSFVWDGMLERLRVITRQAFSKPYS